MKFKFIHQLNNKQFENLFKLVNSNDMNNLGNGKKWSYSKLIDVFNYDIEDFNNNYINSKYLYNVLVDNNNIVGLCFIHPGFNEYIDKNTIGIIINDKYKNKGYSKLLIDRIIKLNKKYFNKKLYSIVNINNLKSNYAFKKYYFQKRIKFNNNYFNVYLIE